MKKEIWYIVVKKDKVLKEYDVYVTRSVDLYARISRTYFSRVFKSKKSAMKYARKLKHTLTPHLNKNEVLKIKVIR